MSNNWPNHHPIRNCIEMKWQEAIDDDLKD